MPNILRKISPGDDDVSAIQSSVIYKAGCPFLLRAKFKHNALNVSEF